MENRFVVDWKKYGKLARQAAAEGIVLLKNDHNVLPLKNEKVSVFGRSQLNYYKSGTGSGGAVNTKYVISILQALQEETQITVNQEILEIYQEWVKNNPFDAGTGWGQEPWSQKEMPLNDMVVKKAARNSEVAIVLIGRTAGEDQDLTAEKGSFYLSDMEEEMLSKVCAVFSRVIVILNTAGIMDMNWIECYQPSAVLLAWQGGQEGGHGVTDVLTGRVNPCGKLTDTIARNIQDYPSDKNFSVGDEIIYAEDIYVGYRYFETFCKNKVLYPFGFGLSYTQFQITCNRFERGMKNSCVSVTVQNTGNTAGKEVVQLYVEPPQGKLGKPIRNLVAFAKTKCLRPKEIQELILKIEDLCFASYDDSNAAGMESCYVLEAGNYQFYIGSDVRKAIPAGNFYLEKTMVMEQCHEAARPVIDFKRMRPAGEKETLVVDWESVPKRKKWNTSYLRSDEIKYVGDQGYRLGDVYTGKITMDQFIAQLSDEDLCCIVRGEGMNSPRVTPGTAAAFGGVTKELQKWGIPAGCCADGPSGIRMDCGTPAFSMPNGTCLACSFNENLVEDLFTMTGAELRKNRIDMLLGPGMNIHRHPLNGRNFEYFSEDPYLTGKIAAAQLRGMNKYGVTGTIKHFAVNNRETHRSLLNSIVSERALREIYLKGFEIAVKEGAAYSVMTTYGALNGIWTAGNFDILTVILRNEWKFEGMVMTDWWATINDEGQESVKSNLAAMVRGQNDVYMVTQDVENNQDNLQESLKNGSLTRGMLQRSAANICTALMKSPIMDRSLGKISQEELEAAEMEDKEDQVQFDLYYHEFEYALELDGANINTEKGSSELIGLHTNKKGNCMLRLMIKVNGDQYSQSPVSVFLNNTLMGVHTLNGTDGKWIEIEQQIGPFFMPYNFLRLYFAQSGIMIQKIKLELIEELDFSL